jgi:hypothetical protein
MLASPFYTRTRSRCRATQPLPVLGEVGIEPDRIFADEIQSRLSQMCRPLRNYSPRQHGASELAVSGWADPFPRSREAIPSCPIFSPPLPADRAAAGCKMDLCIHNVRAYLDFTRQRAGQREVRRGSPVALGLVQSGADRRRAKGGTHEHVRKTIIGLGGRHHNDCGSRRAWLRPG